MRDSSFDDFMFGVGLGLFVGFVVFMLSCGVWSTHVEGLKKQALESNAAYYHEKTGEFTFRVFNGELEE